MTSRSLHTRRLLLRRWRDDDREVLARINADPEVMRYRFKPLTRQETDELIDEFEASFDEHGFGLWAIERTVDRQLLGYVGLEVAGDDAPYRPLIHIGWHLAADAWGRGYATEAATAVLDHAFDELVLAELIAHTTAPNERSCAVMRRLGMHRDPHDDFDGQWYPEGHPYRRFVLYRITAEEWRARRPGDGPVR